jgi:hypothetical protein
VSAYFAILDAIKRTLDGVPGMPPVTVREVPWVLATDFPLPAVLVCPLAEAGEAVGRVCFGGAVRWHYPVLVLLLHASARPSAALPGRLQLRQDIRDALFEPTLAGVAEVYDVAIDPKAVADVAAALGANVAVAGMRVVYRATEQAGWTP